MAAVMRNGRLVEKPGAATREQRTFLIRIWRWWRLTNIRGDRHYRDNWWDYQI